MNIISKIVKTLFPGSEWSGAFYPLTNTSYNVHDLSRTDYLKLYISRQYVAVSTIANTVASLEFTLTKGKENEIKHQHLQLLTYELLQSIVSSLQLTGSCYLHKSMIGKTIDSLEHFRTDLVTIEENEDWSIKGYRYNNKNKNYLFTKEEIIDISLYSPLKTYPYTVKWVSPMQAIAIQAEMDTTANKWNWNFFKNGGSIRDVLSTTSVMTPEQKERVISKRKSEFQGVNNSHKLAVLDNGLQYQNVSASQKELDFVESRRFTRDEILAVFKIPKSVIGITDDVNRASATVWQETYYRVCINPLAKMLEDIFNKELFFWIGEFKFINVIPTDNEALTVDYTNWAITINEYRKLRGYPPIKWGDVLKTTTENVEIIDEKKKTFSEEVRNNIKSIINKHTKGTPEYKKAREEQWEMKRQKKVQRTDKFEIKYIDEVNAIFKEQEKEYTQQVLSKKEVKANTIKNITRWVVALTPLYKEIFQSEGNEALNELGITTMFQSGSNTINRWIKDNIRKVAKEVDLVTKDKVFNIIEQWNKDWIGAEAIARNISSKFEEFSRVRSRTIARTEITRASTQAEIQAYKDSWLVEAKEWYTAKDERVCEYCWPMMWKTVWLDKNFFNKGDTFNGLKLDYADVDWPALHPNCRCTLLPVIR